MCSNAGTKRKSLYAAVKFERPVKPTAGRGQRQLDGVDGRRDAEQRQEHHVQTDEEVPGDARAADRRTRGAAVPAST